MSPAVKHGLIPLTPQERAKLETDGLDVIHDIYRRKISDNIGRNVLLRVSHLV